MKFEDALEQLVERFGKSIPAPTTFHYADGRVEEREVPERREHAVYDYQPDTDLFLRRRFVAVQLLDRRELRGYRVEYYEVPREWSWQDPLPAPWDEVRYCGLGVG